MEVSFVGSALWRAPHFETSNAARRRLFEWRNVLNHGTDAHSRLLLNAVGLIRSSAPASLFGRMWASGGVVGELPHAIGRGDRFDQPQCGGPESYALPGKHTSSCVLYRRPSEKNSVTVTVASNAPLGGP